MKLNRKIVNILGIRQPLRLGLICVCVAGASALGSAACSSDSNGNGNTGGDGAAPLDGAATEDTTVVADDSSSDDGSVAAQADGAVDATADAGIVSPDAAMDASGDATVVASMDATPDELADGPAPTFCESQVGLAFCDDFDSPGALSLDGGASSAWTTIVGSPAELSVSSAISASAPNSLLVSLPDGPNDAGGNGDRSAKVVKQLTPPAGVAQAVCEFDMYIASEMAATSNGGFATDFQFTDGNGADQFGFRIGIFANASGFDHVDLEHNHPILGGNDDIVSPITGFAAGAWNHVKMAVAFAAVSAAADAGDTVQFQMYLNRSANAVIDATYPAPFASAPFARIAAGVVYAFDGNNKAWNINYDNFTLKIQ